MNANEWDLHLVNSVRDVAGDTAAATMTRRIEQPSDLPDVDFDPPAPDELTKAESDEAADRAEARDTAQREWRAR